MVESIKVAKGLEGVIVDKTAIATTDREGNLLYRGYRVVDLAEKRDFESVAYLVFHGKLPSSEEKGVFSRFLVKNSGLDPRVPEVMRLMKETNIMNSLRSMVSICPYQHNANPDLLMEIASKIPSIIYYSDAALTGRKEVFPQEGSYAERFYYLLTGRKDTRMASYLEKLLVMYMEHEFNASTFALRVAASTLADPVSAVTAALSTLKGPLHGGANSEVLQYLLKFRSNEEAVEFIKEKLARKEKIMGFGHRVYKIKDPRAQYVKSKLKTLSEARKYIGYAEAIENYMWEEKQIPANLDFYGALLMHSLGIEEKFYLPIFAASRVFGWSAHYVEQVSDNKIIRPQSEYVGPVGLEVP